MKAIVLIIYYKGKDKVNNMDKIKVVGARLHNLKNLNVEIPKKRW